MVPPVLTDRREIATEEQPTREDRKSSFRVYSRLLAFYDVASTAL